MARTIEQDAEEAGVSFGAGAERLVHESLDDAADDSLESRPPERGAASEVRKRRLGRDRRGAPRCSARGVVRYGRLWQVEVLDVGPSGLRVQSEVPFRFGPGCLRLSASGKREELDVALLWSRLVGTKRGEFGEICPLFHSGLEVDGASLGAWRAALPALKGSV